MSVLLGRYGQLFFFLYREFPVCSSPLVQPEADKPSSDMYPMGPRGGRLPYPSSLPSGPFFFFL